MSSSLPSLPIAKPVMGAEELEAVRQVLESGWLTQGPWVRKFESAFAERHGVKHAFATTSCTTALHLALVAAGIGPGDEVILPAFTWVATANVVMHCGAKPVFVDILPASYNIDPNAVSRAVSPRTKAIIPVHLFGLAADMNAIGRALDGRQVLVIEDAACAAGAAYHGQAAGSLGHMGCFSLHPRKSITCGEGGVVTTNDDRLAGLLDKYRNHGASIPEEVRHRGPKPYELPEFEVFGFNYRMTDIQAAVASVQLQKLDVFIAERRRLADRLDEGLRRIGWITPPARPQEYSHAWQAYVAMVADDAPQSRNEILLWLQEQGIGGRPGTHSVVGLAAYRKRLGTNPANFPVATRAEAQSIALPLHNHMGPADVDRVVAALEEL
ncbi:perosamine synthetase [Bradyrhizobium sp. USDA 4518]